MSRQKPLAIERATKTSQTHLRSGSSQIYIEDSIAGPRTSQDDTARTPQGAPTPQIAAIRRNTPYAAIKSLIGLTASAAQCAPNLLDADPGAATMPIR